MRITVEIDAKKLKAIQRATGIEMNSPALARALDEFLVNKEREQFLKRVVTGGTDYSSTNDDLEQAVFDGNR